MEKRVRSAFITALTFICLFAAMPRFPIEYAESRPSQGDEYWYLLNDDWVNVTVNEDVTVAISRGDGLIHWYWNRTPNLDRAVVPYSAVRVETWGYNDGVCFEKVECDTRVSKLDDVLVVDLNWKTPSSREADVAETLVFHRDRPYFLVSAKQRYSVEPNATELTSGCANGLEPQVCVFLRGGDEGGVVASDKSSAVTPYSVEYNNSAPITYQWMEHHEKFPWMYLHDESDNATVGVVVLNVHPPVYDLMASGSDLPNEVQITFMDAGEGGASGVWYFPEGFEWFTQFIVYPTYDDDPPYHDKIDLLAEEFYGEEWVSIDFTSHAFASGAVVNYPPGFERMTILNKIGMLYMYGDHGIIFWNGTVPRHGYRRVDGSPCHLLAFSSGWYNVSNDLGSVSGCEGWSGVSCYEGSRYGRHVAVSEIQTIVRPGQGLDVSLTHTWETWNDSDKFRWTMELEVLSPSKIARAYFKMREFGEVLQLNETAFEIWTDTVWGSEPAVTLVFEKDSVKYDQATGLFYIHLLDNPGQVEYPAGRKFRIQFYLWPHYGHIQDPSQITSLHTVSTEVIAPFHTHFYRDLEMNTLATYYTNATFVDAKFFASNKELDVTIIGEAMKAGMIKINASQYGAPVAALNAIEFSVEGDIATVYTEPSPDPETVMMMFGEEVKTIRISVVNLTRARGVDWDPFAEHLRIQMSAIEDTVLQLHCGDYGEPEVIYRDGVAFEEWTYAGDAGNLSLNLSMGTATFDFYFQSVSIGGEGMTCIPPGMRVTELVILRISVMIIILAIAYHVASENCLTVG